MTLAAFSPNFKEPIGAATLQYFSQVEIPIKIVVIGRGAVGKTSLIRCLFGSPFVADHLETEFQEVRQKSIDVAQGKVVKMTLTDVAGQTQYQTVTNNFFRGTSVMVVTASIDEDQSWEDAKNWLKHAREMQGTVTFQCSTATPQEKRDKIKAVPIPVILAVTKCDLPVAKRKKTEEQIREFCEEIGARHFICTSSKENLHVQDLFQAAAREGLEALAESMKDANLIEVDATQDGVFSDRRKKKDKCPCKS